MTAQRHALTFRVKAGSEAEAASILSSYGRPAAEMDANTRVLSTTILMKDNIVVRVIEIEGSMPRVMQHLDRQPVFRAIEEEINPHLEEARDMSTPDSLRGFFARALMDDVVEPGPVHAPGERPQGLRPHAVLYPIKAGRGAEAEGCFSTAGATTVFRKGDTFVRFWEFAGSPEEALEHLVSVALEENVGERLEPLLATTADLSDAAGWRSFFGKHLLRVVTHGVAEPAPARPAIVAALQPAAARKTARVIDFHSHLVPRRWGQVGDIPPQMLDADGFFRRKEEDGISLSVLINAMFHHHASREDFRGLKGMQEFMEFAHGLMAAHPGRVTALIGVNPFLGDPVLRAMEQAVGAGGFPGVTVNSSVDGELLDSPRAADFWALAARLNVPVFVHPPFIATSQQVDLDPRFLGFAVRPLDVTLGAAAIVTGGIFHRHPDIRIVLAAGGGALSAIAERLDLGYSGAEMGLGTLANSPGGGSGATAAAASGLPARPSEYIRKFYVDTCVHGTHAFMANLDHFGPRQIVFGTDYPPVDLPISHEIDLVESILSSAEDRERVLYGNAAELLGLP